MAYTRPFIELKNPETDPLFIEYGHLGELSDIPFDSGWLRQTVNDLHAEARLGLSQIESTIERVGALDFSEFKEEIAEQKKLEPILKARQALMTFLKAAIDKAQTNLDQTRGLILRQTEPERQSDPLKAVAQLLTDQEIRQLIRGTDPRGRRAMIENNPSFIKAAIGSPDPLIDADSLHSIRREFAFSQDPSLRAAEQDAERLYDFTRKRAGSINSTAILLLINAGLPDPINPEQHFSIFPPRTDQEKLWAGKKIQKWRSDLDSKQRQKRWDETHPPKAKPLTMEKARQKRK